MLLITCPWCGPRAQIEFTYGGDASVARPADPEAVSAGEWLDHVYFRDNPRGPHNEWWQHSSGCRSWVKVRRDTWSHRVYGSGPPAANLGGDGSGPAGAGGDRNGSSGAGPGKDVSGSPGATLGENESGSSGADPGENGSGSPGTAPGEDGSR